MQPEAILAAPVVDDDDLLEGVTRATAALTGLSIEAAWWPGVLAHLSRMVELGEALEPDTVTGAR